MSFLRSLPRSSEPMRISRFSSALMASRNVVRALVSATASLAAAASPAEVRGEGAVAEGSEVEEALRLTAELDLGGVRDVEAGAIVANVGANVPRGAGSLDRRVAADDQNRRRGQGVSERCGAAGSCQPAPAQKRRSRRCGGDRCCWCRGPCERTSAAGMLLRSSCGSSR